LILSKALARITTFQQEHRLFKNEFKFQNKTFVEHLQHMASIISGYLQLKNKDHPALAENGLLLEKHDLSAQQKVDYEAWYAESVANTGKLSLPDLSQIEAKFLPEKPKKQGSRIENALKKMEKEQKDLLSY
jgi:hypothetical protein